MRNNDIKNIDDEVSRAYIEMKKTDKKGNGTCNTVERRGKKKRRGE
jgi:hypothetical protein